MTDIIKAAGIICTRPFPESWLKADPRYGIPEPEAWGFLVPRGATPLCVVFDEPFAGATHAYILPTTTLPHDGKPQSVHRLLQLGQLDTELLRHEARVEAVFYGMAAREVVSGAGAALVRSLRPAPLVQRVAPAMRRTA